MGQLTSSGYIPQSPSDMQNEIQTEAISQVPGFTGLPSELRTDLIQESTIVGLKLDAMVADLLNGVAPTFANDFIFQQFGASLGLPMNGQTTSQVTVNFTGAAGDYIPNNTACQNTGGTITVYTMSDGVIPASGTVSILCQTTQSVLIGANTITVMVDPISGVTLTNPATGVQGVAAETIGAYRQRMQNSLQGPRIGQITRAYELLEKIPGVNPLLISFTPGVITKTVDSTPTAFPGIMAVVGGGEDNAVAGALFNAFLQTKNLISVPVKGTEVDVTISVYNNTFPVSFTRPLESTLEIDLTIVLQNASYSQDLMEQMLSTAFTNYLNGLQLGSPINQYEMDQIIFNTMSPSGILPTNLKSIAYVIKIDGTPTSFVNGNIPIAFDQYLTLSTLTLALS